MNGTCISVFAVCSIAAITAAASAQYEYEFILLEPFPGSPCCTVNVFDINEKDIAVGQSSADGPFTTFSWTETEGMIDLPGNKGRSINNLNHVIVTGMGSTIDALTGEVVHPIGAVMRDMNDAGVAVGADYEWAPGCEPFNCTWDCYHPLLWTSAVGLTEPMPIVETRVLTAINNSSIAVGEQVFGCNDTSAVVWDMNTDNVTLLSDLLPPISSLGIRAQTEVVDVSDNGDVLGLRVAGSDPERMYIWNQDSGFTILPPLPDGFQPGSDGNVYMNPESINVHREVVGSAIKFGDDYGWVAFIYDPEHGTRDLNDLADVPEGLTLEQANAINDNGWIVGAVRMPPIVNIGPLYGFILKPIDSAPSGDLDSNGTVNTEDLLQLLAAWGKCNGCPEDIDGDGTVGTSDLLMLLANWG